MSDDMKLKNKSIGELIEMRKKMVGLGYPSIVAELEGELNDRGYFSQDDYICICDCVGDNPGCYVHGNRPVQDTSAIDHLVNTKAVLYLC